MKFFWPFLLSFFAGNENLLIFVFAYRLYEKLINEESTVFFELRSRPTMNWKFSIHCSAPVRGGKMGIFTHFVEAVASAGIAACNRLVYNLLPMCVVSRFFLYARDASAVRVRI